MYCNLPKIVTPSLALKSPSPWESGELINIQSKSWFFSSEYPNIDAISYFRNETMESKKDLLALWPIFRVRISIQWWSEWQPHFPELNQQQKDDNLNRETE